MSDDEPKSSARSLVNSILKKAAPDSEGAPPTEAQKSAEEEQALSPEDIATLISIYFDLEEPEERDEAFAQISQCNSPLALDFLGNMLSADHDPYLRSAAAARLARLGHPEAVALLGEDLNDPEEPFFFEQAALALGEIIGPPFFDTLRAIWADPQRDPEDRRAAMLAMETLDSRLACEESLGFLQGLSPAPDLPEEEIEAAVLLFARHDFTEATGELQRLQDLAEAAADTPEARGTTRAFFEEAQNLLSPNAS